MLYDSDVAVTPCFKDTENCVVAESGDLKGTDPLLGLRIGVTAKQSAADGLTTTSGSVSPEEKATGMLLNGYCTGQASGVNPGLAPPTVQWAAPIARSVATMRARCACSSLRTMSRPPQAR